MAQGSKPRHSRRTRKPVTIDLEPEAVSKGDPETNNGAAKAASDSKPTSESAAKTPDTKADAGKPKEAEKAERVTEQAARAAKAMPEATDKKPTAAQAAKPAEKPKAKTVPDSSKGSPDRTGDANGGSNPQKPGGGGRSIVVGLVGAVIALAAFAGLQWSGVLPAPSGSGGSSSELAELKQTVAALETQVSDASASVGSAIESRLSALENTASTSGGQDVSDLDARVSSLADKVEALGGVGGDNGGPKLAEKVSSIEGAQTALQADVQKLTSELSALTTRISTDEGKQDQALKSLEDRVASVEQSLSSPREDIKVARALAAASLKAAIDRGGSFMAELEAFASVDGDSPAIGQLRSFAASGVPSRTSLTNEFPTVAAAMIKAADGSGADSGWFGRLVDSASSVVKVRPVGDVSGDSADAIVARMEFKLNNGDLQGAIDEWKTLPEASQEVSQDYEKNLQARLTVEKIVAGTVNAALPADNAGAAAASSDTKQPSQAGDGN
ncbi:mitofilin family membrane protein [Hoeflea prorocentri]|uniref:Mitofilin family membrane protein n=1 Tax=Hoeflea prorocentri TaxID=1922333 RepID=A0A9X3UMK0_9HYPH|nr:mitofilin family membrane protein [Hoeflea prorocentri]MCY6383306.1 mitofilin family membrane protein [Hoeflea prorocentri]MDA5401106.1 mitofilin family membrane protein [Hoeflea prorocentri]